MERDKLPPTDACFEVEDLEGVVAAIERGERPAHLDACPRCRALLASCRTFLDPTDPPEGSDITDASRRLALPALLGWEGRRSAEGRSADSVSSAKASARRSRWRFDMPWLRPIYAVAAILLVAFVAREIVPGMGRQDPSRVLRGHAPAAASVELLAPRADMQGSIVLEWHEVSGAESYDMIVYRQDLSVVKRMKIAKATSVTLTSDDVTALGAAHAAYWQVIATKGGEELARSAPVEFRLPGTNGR